MEMRLFKERSQDWLAFRKQHVSATEVGSLLGVNSYMSAQQLFEQKTSNSFDKLDNEHMRDGRASEAMIFALLEEEGWSLERLAPKGSVVVYVDENMGLSSTPDNFRWDEPGVVEVKKTSRQNFEKNWSGGLPPLRYLVQVQAQMHTTGMKQGFLVCGVLEDNIPIAIYKVGYSKIFSELMGRAIIDFKYSLLDRPEKKLRVDTKIKNTAVALLKDSYGFLGVFRFGGRTAFPESVLEVKTDVSLEELFK